MAVLTPAEHDARRLANFQRKVRRNDTIRPPTNSIRTKIPSRHPIDPSRIRFAREYTDMIAAKASNIMSRRYGPVTTAMPLTHEVKGIIRRSHLNRAGITIR
jgi:hypothetical protein